MTLPENSLPSTVTIEVQPDASGEPAPQIEAAEVVAEAAEEIAEEVADASVQIAAIESETTIAVEAIRAETDQARIALESEAITAERERDEQWREMMETNMRELRERVEALLSAPASIPQPLTEAALEVAEEVAAEPEAETTSLSILPDISAPTSETVTEVTAESENGNRAEVIVRKRRRAI